MTVGERTFLPALAPVKLLYVAGLIYLVVLGSCLWIVTHQTFLGLQFSNYEQGNGLSIRSTIKSQDRLNQLDNEVLIAISDGRQTIELNELSMMQEPDNFTNYAEYNAFFDHLAALYEIASHPRVTLYLANGDKVQIQTDSIRPVADLPYQFWLMQLFSGIGFFIGIWIWGFRRGKLSSRLLAVGGLGFMLAGACVSCYGYRELAFNPDQFKLLANINHLSNSLFAYSLMILLCYYPSRLFKAPVVFIGFFSCVVIWLNEVFQGIQILVHTFYFLQYFLPAVLGIIFGRLQWLKHKNDPVAKASIRWFLLTLFLSVGIVVLLYFGPTLFNEAPLLPLWVAQFVLLGLYIGFVFGVLQYRLFQIERWWFACWVWFFAGIFVSLIDVVLVYTFNVHPLNSLSISILVTAWLYFPLRHWVWQLTFHSAQSRLETFYPLLLESYISSGSVERFKQNWPKVLKNFYRPLSIQQKPNGLNDVSIVDQGYSILIPDIDESTQHWEVSGMDNGSKLFSVHEVDFIRTAVKFSRKCIEWGKGRDEIAKQERDRITRDLHDDVGALLLTLIHKSETPENSELARSALKGVRETIYSLRDDHRETIQLALSVWREEIFKRLEAANVQLYWYAMDMSEEIVLSPRQRINLDRILREAITNILKHAQPRSIIFNIQEQSGRLDIKIIDDGNVTDPNSWKPHTGLFNMHNRANEIKVSLTWTILLTSPAKTQLTISLPLK